jgi:hypothetical protein
MAVTVQCSKRDFFAYARTLAVCCVKFTGGPLPQSALGSVPNARRTAQQRFNCFRYSFFYSSKSRFAFLTKPSV